jgi:RND family efflux transporter MFP subunit
MENADLSHLKIDKQALRTRPPVRRSPLLWIAATILILAIFSWKLLFPQVIQVETATVSQVYPTQAFTLLNASGYVVAQRKAALAAKTTGRLEWLGVEEGRRVSQGEVIARLEGRDAEASRQQAAAGLKSATALLEQSKAEAADTGRSYQRLQELLRQGIVAQAEYDTAEARNNRARAGVAASEANVGSARAALAGADVYLDYTRIRAPFDGVVLTKNADVGDIVTPLGAAANAKASVVTIADLSSLQVEADVSEANLEKVRKGQPCEIQLDALPTSRFKGYVHAIVPTADRSKATVMVKIGFHKLDPRILPEMSAKVAFLEREATLAEILPKTAVNPASVAQRSGKNVAYVIKGDRVVETELVLGNKVGGVVEVLAGLKPGDRIVLKPLEKLKNGTKIKVSEK